MRPLTYFAFTLLSVAIQFCVMDFIQEKVELEHNPISHNQTINNRNFINASKDNTQNALALYYRVNKNIGHQERDLSGSKYLTTTLQNVSISTTTQLSFTVFDVLYNENVTITDGLSTTEMFITSTETDNVTEITLFEKNTSTTARPVMIAKKTKSKVTNCHCDLLFKQCDINCCCDVECSLADKGLFDNCKSLSDRNKYNPLRCDSDRSAFTNLFCIARTNLPERRAVVIQKSNEAVLSDVFLWHDNNKQVESYNFDRNVYKKGAPVWILKNQSISHLDLPASATGNYCNVRRKITFLKNEKISCLVKLKDLEMFRVLKAIDESTVISVGNHSVNHSVTNCSSLHCTDWTITYCDRNDCFAYNKSIHEPVCRDSLCKEIALKIEYIFYINDSKIVNATIKLHAQETTFKQYMAQEIGVKFYIGTTPSDRIVKLSGNPGYITGMPLIVSHSETNYSENFFNSKIDDHNLSYAENKGGFCVLTRLTRKDIQFGLNKRTKCRISLRPISTLNGTEACIIIQSVIYKMIGVNRKAYISPYGNPEHVPDHDWLPVELDTKFMYGEFHSKNTKLECFSILTRVAFIFTYSDLSDPVGRQENKLLTAAVDMLATNVTFNAVEYSTVITIDTNFINVNDATRQELAGPPHLDLNLPKNFFFPFPSNECCRIQLRKFVIILLCAIKLFR